MDIENKMEELLLEKNDILLVHIKNMEIILDLMNIIYNLF